MSNNPDDEEDSFNAERLNSAKQGEVLKDAQKRSRTESFTSFSDGMPAVDKFGILGMSGTHERVTKQFDGVKNVKPAATAKTVGPKKREVVRSVMRRPKDEESFDSFSQGLPTVDKFAILDANADLVVSLPDFVAAGSSPYFSKKQDDCKTFNRLMFLIDSMPWSDAVHVESTAKPEFCEYCFDEQTIVLNNTYSEEQKILAFAHQSYHATNKLLTKLYEDEEKLDRAGFIDLYLWAEVAALITELNVRRELGIKDVPPPKVLCQESDGSTYSINVEDHLKSKGMKAMHDLLFHSFVRGSHDLGLVFVFDKLFEQYDQHFEHEKQIARMYIDLCMSQGLERECI